MSLKHVDLESALRRLADRRIEEAMREGKFDKLAGAGKPLDLEPMPADENARMTWWMLRILKGGNFTPDEVRLRRQIEQLKEQLATAASEQRVEVLVKAVNGLVHQLNTMGTNAINLAVSPVSLETERQRLRDRRAKQEEEARAARADESRAALHRKPAATAPVLKVEVVTCANALCRHENPAFARFCRTCGKILQRR